MPPFEKSPRELVERFERVADSLPDVERRKMFGYPCIFANGHLATSLMGSDWMVRLPEARRAELLAEPGAHLLEPMAGRPMKEYVAFPRGWTTEPERMRPWIEEALAYVRAMPRREPKEPKPRTRRAGA